MELRPIEVKQFASIHDVHHGQPELEFHGFFHRWIDHHHRLGEQEIGGAGAIVERRDGQVTLVMLNEVNSLRFTDVGPVAEETEDVKCETCWGGPNTTDCKDCDGTGWVKRVVPKFGKNQSMKAKAR